MNPDKKMSRLVLKVIFALLPKAVFASLFFFLSFYAAIGQDSIQQRGSKSMSLEECERLIIESYSLCVPKEYKFLEKLGIDLSYWEYIDTETVIRVYTGPGAPSEGAFAQSLASFRKERVFVSDVFTTIWSFEDESPDHRYVVGARYYIEGTEKGHALSIFIRFNDQDFRETAESIIHSFQVEPNATR